LCAYESEQSAASKKSLSREVGKEQWQGQRRKRTEITGDLVRILGYEEKRQGGEERIGFGSGEKSGRAAGN